MINSPWMKTFPQTKVHHLPRTHYNHAPLLISLFDHVIQGSFPFRCKELWIEHPQFREFFVNNWALNNNDFIRGRSSFLDKVKSWNSNVFGNLNKQKKRLIARLNGIQIALANKHSNFFYNLEKNLLLDLKDIFNKERIIWAQKAGLNWRKYGDYNTRYFHVLATVRKTRGKILTLKNEVGNWITDSNELKNMAVTFLLTFLLLNTRTAIGSLI